MSEDISFSHSSLYRNVDIYYEILLRPEIVILLVCTVKENSVFTFLIIVSIILLSILKVNYKAT